MAIDPVPAITEAEATGEVAAIYTDIRAALGIGVVNLVWRHLATIEGALPWVWRALKPLYVSGAAAREATALFDELALPSIGVFPPALLRSAGVSDQDRATVCAILDSYNRGNSLNLIALSALTATPSGDGPSTPSDVMEAVAAPIPGLPGLDAMTPDVRDTVLALSALGAGPGDRIIPSLYRHLSYWPGFLGLTWSLIAPLHADGRLRSLMQATHDAGHRHAGRIAGAVDLAPEPATADAARAAIEEFRRTAIGRMVPIAMIIRRTVV